MIAAHRRTKRADCRTPTCHRKRRSQVYVTSIAFSEIPFCQSTARVVMIGQKKVTWRFLGLIHRCINRDKGKTTSRSSVPMPASSSLGCSRPRRTVRVWVWELGDGAADALVEWSSLSGQQFLSEPSATSESLVDLTLTVNFQHPCEIQIQSSIVLSCASPTAY